MIEDVQAEWLLKVIKAYALRGLKRVVREQGHRIVGNPIVAGFEVSKAVLASETQRMVESNEARAVVKALFLEFMFGVGPRTRYFGPGSVMALRMKDAHGVQKARAYFYKTRAEAYRRNTVAPGTLALMPLTNYGYRFGLSGVVRAGDDIVEQFIGSYAVEMFPDKEATQIKVVCRNTTSSYSFLYHLPFVESYERGRGFLPTPMGNIRQVIVWSEPIDHPLFSSSQE